MRSDISCADAPTMTVVAVDDVVVDVAAADDDISNKKDARDAEDGYLDVTDSIESNKKVYSAHSAHQSHSPLTADVDTSRVQQRDDAVNWVASFFGGSRSS